MEGHADESSVGIVVSSVHVIEHRARKCGERPFALPTLEILECLEDCDVAFELLHGNLPVNSGRELVAETAGERDRDTGECSLELLCPIGIPLGGTTAVDGNAAFLPCSRVERLGAGL